MWYKLYAIRGLTWQGLNTCWIVRQSEALDARNGLNKWGFNHTPTQKRQFVKTEEKEYELRRLKMAKIIL